MRMMTVAALQRLPVFPFAARFSFLSDDDIMDLAQSIELDGLIHPIIIYEGQILDGRNRLKALSKTDVYEVEIKEFSGTYHEAVLFILASNVRRRHLDTWELGKLVNDPDVKKAAQEKAKAAQGKRTDLVDLTQEVGEGEPKKKSKHETEAVALAIEAVGGGISSESARKVNKIQLAVDEGAVERLKKLDSGEWTLGKAWNDYEAAQQETSKKMHALETGAADLYFKVDKGELSVNDAYVQLESRIAAKKRETQARSQVLYSYQSYAQLQESKINGLKLEIAKLKTADDVEEAIGYIADVEHHLADAKRALNIRLSQLDADDGDDN